jgi:MFS transporter, BCD family, chlorophyll transporter
MNSNFGWLSIVRLGLVQACLGAVVVLTTSTLNRVMVVELALPALLPGILVAMHYLVQIVRPRMGHGSDVGGRRTPWIIGGIAVLGAGGALAALATVWMGTNRMAGIALAVFAFALIGLGVSAAGTSLLVLLAKRVAEERRAAAATIVWMMMIVGFAVTAGIAGHLLDPYSPERLLMVSASVSLIAFVVTLLAIYRVESNNAYAGTLRSQALASSKEYISSPSSQTTPKPRFREALAQVWSEPQARHFTIFVFVSMLAYSAQDLILEPFAGAVFGYTPGGSTKLSSVQHGGVLMGMILVALAGGRFGSLRAWTVGGCLASALALSGLVAAGFIGTAWPLKATVFAMGVANGAFSIAAIGSMMRLAGEGKNGREEGREGVRMGLWGAAQAVAFGLGGLVGTGASDLAQWLMSSKAMAYSTVFGFEALLFIVSAVLAMSIGKSAKERARTTALEAHQERRDQYGHPVVAGAAAMQGSTS